MAVLREAYVLVVPDLAGFDDTLKRALRKVDVDRQGKQMGNKLGDSFAKGFSERSSTFVRTAATMASKMTLVGSAAAAAAPGVLQLTAALVPAAGAAVALPAGLLAIQAASASMKIAVMGVGEALKAGFGTNSAKAKKALEALPPEARKFTTSIVGMQTQLESVRATISDNFFGKFNGQIADLATKYLPLARTGLGGISGSIGSLASEFGKAAKQGTLFGGLSALLSNTRAGLDGMRGAVGPLTNALGDLLRVTAGTVREAGVGFGNLSTRFAAFVSQAANSGRIMEVFRQGIATLKTLGGILSNIGGIFGTVFRAATVNSGNLLTNLRDLTGQIRTFLESAQGGAALRSLFSTLSVLGQSMRTALAAVLPAVAKSIQAMAPALNGLAPAFAQLVVAVAPLLPYFVSLASTVLVSLVPAIAALAGWLQKHQGVMKAAVIAVGAFVAAQKIAGVVMRVNAGIMAVQAAGGLMAFLRGTKLVAAATKVWAGIQWLMNAALTANPIGIAVVAIGALVAAIVVAYRNSSTFRSVVQAAWKGIQTAVSVAWNSYIKPALTALVKFFRETIAPAALWLWRNVLRPAFTGIGYVVKAAWVVIKIALTAFRNYIMSVVVPMVKFLYNNVFRPIFTLIGNVVRSWWNGIIRPTFNFVKSAFSALGTALKGVWDRVIRPMFQAFGGFINGTVRPAFKKGVDAIVGLWNSLKEAARKPVAFVVNSVINPLVKGINAAAAFVNIKDRVPEIRGFARGGQIPGRPSVKDNLLANGPNGLLKVASGEFIVNTRTTQKHLPFLQALNAGKVDPTMDGFARGGRVGRPGEGDGIGDFFKKIINGAKGIGDFILDPKKGITNLANAALGRIPGSGGFVNLLRGMGSKLIGGVGKWITDKISGFGGAIGGGSIGGGYRGMQRLISARFPGLGMISGFRQGARTLSGRRSYHSMGRAVDYPPNRALAAWIRATYGSKTKELITPFQSLNLLNGRPHRYTGAVWRQHNFAGGNAHVHWAAALGGLIGRRSGLPFGSYDRGGYLPTGLSLAHNGTGRPEPVGHGLGGNTYNLNVTVPVGVHPAEVGRRIVESIKQYEAASGARWRTA